ncbi:FtsK/SpoIIIE domain-containing protein [Virgibacillus ndiopensis]|uniref:FtsK/SpoIIIE domain-containing protein n=1 Tax=Virgibacillus ndiopensis TaxID=2004408 RepID=UPI000C074226|nr:FtsK/SpoIIIE domain-containing protein [Virgibacillus ndiopensis]
MDLLIGGGLASFIIYAAAKWNKNDKEKIQHTFRNINYKVGDHEPKLFKTHKTKTSTLYTYHVPYGLVDDPRLEVLEKVLNRPVKISFTNTKLHINVYNQKLNKSYPYALFKLKGNWSIPVGMSQEGVIYHDFDTIPHMIVAGSTTWGKTVFMRMMMTHLIENNPNGVEFYILDLKGGLAFHRYRNLKQVKIMAGNYKESYQALSMVKKDIEKDMDYLKSIDAENAKEGNIPTRKIIIIDEAGELAPSPTMSDDDKEYVKGCQRIMSYVARVAGQIGYKMIFGTQYPTAEILNNQIKANAVARVSFRLTTSVQSGVAIDQPGAEKLEYPGRAIYKTVDEYLVQTPFISKEEIKERLGDYFVSTTAKEKPETRTDHVIFG